MNSHQAKFGVAMKKQANYTTSNPSADFWTLTKTGGGFANFATNTETDAEDLGKGTAHATQSWIVSNDVTGTFERPLSSEWAAFLFAFGLGSGNLTTAAEGETGTEYTVTALDACDDDILPAFTVAEQAGVGCASTVLDRKAVGCAVSDFSINFNPQPGRRNTTTTMNFIGSGKQVSPSAITLPTAPLTEHLLSGANASVTVGATDYSASGKLLNLSATFNNNIDPNKGYFIGSGTDTNGGAIKGYLRAGTQSFGLNFTARLTGTSDELSKLSAQTTGIVTITLPGATFETTHQHSLKLTYHKVVISAATVADENGEIVVQVTATPMLHPTNGILTAEVVTTIEDIGSATA